MYFLTLWKTASKRKNDSTHFSCVQHHQSGVLTLQYQFTVSHSVVEVVFVISSYPLILD